MCSREPSDETDKRPWRDSAAGRAAPWRVRAAELRQREWQTTQPVWLRSRTRSPRARGRARLPTPPPPRRASRLPPRTPGGAGEKWEEGFVEGLSQIGRKILTRALDCYESQAVNEQKILECALDCNTGQAATEERASVSKRPTGPHSRRRVQPDRKK